jgi:hypothetical protein
MRRLVAIVVVVAAAAWLPASAQASFGIDAFSVAATEAGGSPATLAGSHPYALTAAIGFAPGGDVKDLHLDLPPGLIENPEVVPRCTSDQFQTPRSSPPPEERRSGESCPEETQIGTIAVDTGSGVRHFGVFNLEPPPGRPSRFGAAPFGAPLVFTPQILMG